MEVENNSECDKINLFQSEKIHGLDHSCYNWVGFLNRIHMKKFWIEFLELSISHINMGILKDTGREITLKASVSILLCSNYNNLL